MDENQNVFAPGFNLPPFWMKDKVVVLNFSSGQAVNNGNVSGLSHQHKLKFICDGLQDFTFPLDPFIGLSFKNVIARRLVAKGSQRGTVKERWTEDDVEITISGVFISDDESFPLEVNLLKSFFEKHKSIDVECSLLNDRDIKHISIESLELPFTKGAGNQEFEIKAYSDDVVELLMKST